MIKLFLTRLSDILILAEIKDKTTENKEEFSDAELNLTNTLKIIKSNISSEEESFIDNDCTERFSVHCKINNLLNIVISIVTESEFSKEIAHHFLNEIDEIINNKINSSFISSQSTPNGLSHLNSFFQQKLDEYNTNNNLIDNNVNKLNKEISDVHQIMAENINLIIDRDRSINSINSLSESIKDDSGKFKKVAYETRLKMMLSKYMIFIVLFGIVFLIIIFKIYF